jgi:hypothetical protein
MKYVMGEITKEVYDQNNNKNIFTAIGTFNDKNGVCQGIASLFDFMVVFSGINDVKVEGGYAIISTGFY